MNRTITRRAPAAAAALAFATAGCGAFDGEESREGRAATAVASTQYPAAEWIPAAAGNYAAGRAGDTVQYIIIHDTEGTFGSAVSWFQTPPRARGGVGPSSAHYIVGRDGRVVQMVSENDTAYHGGISAVNTRTIGVEHEGWWDNRLPFTDALYRASARLVATLATRYQIPIDRAHVIGHYQIFTFTNEVRFCPATTSYWSCVNQTQLWSHRDPGEFWDWDRYMRLVREEAARLAGSDAGVAGPDGNGGDAAATPGAWSCSASAFGARQYWTCDGSARARCDAAGTPQREACAAGCYGRAAGVDDYCRAPGWSCARSAWNNAQYWTCADGRNLYRCVDAASVPVVVACARGCALGAAGTDDRCN